MKVDKRVFILSEKKSEEMEIVNTFYEYFPLEVLSVIDEDAKNVIDYDLRSECLTIKDTSNWYKDIPMKYYTYFVLDNFNEKIEDKSFIYLEYIEHLWISMDNKLFNNFDIYNFEVIDARIKHYKSEFIIYIKSLVRGIKICSKSIEKRVYRIFSESFSISNLISKVLNKENEEWWYIWKNY